jgi:hypothetical protein
LPEAEQHCRWAWHQRVGARFLHLGESPLYFSPIQNIVRHERYAQYPSGASRLFFDNFASGRGVVDELTYPPEPRNDLLENLDMLCR